MTSQGEIPSGCELFTIESQIKMLVGDMKAELVFPDNIEQEAVTDICYLRSTWSRLLLIYKKIRGNIISTPLTGTHSTAGQKSIEFIQIMGNMEA